MDEEANPRWRSSLPDGKPAHFFKIILPTAILDKKLRVPKAFVNQHGDDFSPIITLHDPNAREWKIGLEKSEDDDVWFSEGWDKFLEYYSITNEHFLVFRYEGDSRFHVLIFDMTGSEIQYPSQNLSPERNQVASSESSKSNHHDYHRSQNDNDNHNDIDNDSDSNNDNDIGIDHHFTEEYFPDDEDDSTHAYEEDDPYYSTSSSKSTSTSPSESTSPTKRRGFTKFIDKSSKRERRKEYSSPSSRSAFRRKRKRHQRGASERGDEQSDGGSNHKRRRSKEGRHGGRAKKIDHVEYVGKQTVKSKSYEKRHISDRVRTKVIQAADNYRSRFPYFRAVLRPHNLYNSFMLLQT
ncbi:B3 domain-containing transcription factor VRN1-like isoform X2 [Prosopis cineraria]|uniref:B3 domain-containing transcription factor VRN1-like isoform X2 n=1 Tax=Prosopis cineraria TaxID=364024 RepID=UPI0024104DC3|nr:B3 domain-containing transcription factor VRN1-like isoform X2 [Prosopis cineraria]